MLRLLALKVGLVPIPVSEGPIHSFGTQEGDVLACDLTAGTQLWAPVPLWIRKESRNLLGLGLAQGCNGPCKIGLSTKQVP